MNTDYQRVENAIHYIRRNVQQQPSLASVAEHVGLSPWHFQRLFQRWAGVSPKRFLEYLTVEQAKMLLEESKSIMDTSLETGLSGAGRLHDQFVSIQAVSPGEYKNRGEDLVIEYGYHDSPFGEILMLLTGRGILSLSFVDEHNRDMELDRLKSAWPGAGFIRDGDRGRLLASRLFNEDARAGERLLLSVRGTNFQVRVWEALLRIPPGSVATYQAVARAIKRPRAVRAVANAIAANPVAWLIPCHRVLRSSGALGGYRWGPRRKQLMLAREWIRSGARAVDTANT